MVDQNRIREILKQSGTNIHPSIEDFNKSFQEIGLDSLDQFSFLSEIEIIFEITFTDEEVESFRSLSDIIEFLNENSN